MISFSERFLSRVTRSDFTLEGKACMEKRVLIIYSVPNRNVLGEVCHVN